MATLQEKRVKQFRKLADSQRKQVEKLSVIPFEGQNMTYRRQRIIDSKLDDKRQAEKLLDKLVALADAWEANTCPDSLIGFSQRSQIEALMNSPELPVVYMRLAPLREMQQQRQDWEKDGYDNIVTRPYIELIEAVLGRTREGASKVRLTPQEVNMALLTEELAVQMHIEGLLRYSDNLKRLKAAGVGSLPAFEQAKADLDALGDPQAGEPTLEEQIAAQERAIALRRIPGYFPTPPAIAKKLAARLRLNEGDLLLEPSAGSGSLVEAALAAYPGIQVRCAEVNAALRQLLIAKQFDVPFDDCLDIDPAKHQFDAVFMNPPFEQGQDIAHVRHCYMLLKPGGRLVAIMSEGTFFRKNSGAPEFREWLDDLGGHSEKLPSDAFKPSGTTAATRVVVVDKPGASFAGGTREDLDAWVDDELDKAQDTAEHMLAMESSGGLSLAAETLLERIRQAGGLYYSLDLNGYSANDGRRLDMAALDELVEAKLALRSSVRGRRMLAGLTRKAMKEQHVAV